MKKTLDEIIDFLKSSIVDVTLSNFSKENLHESLKLMDDLGLDSLDYASVMLSGEEFVGGKLNENNINWSDIKTIEDLAILIEKCQ